MLAAERLTDSLKRTIAYSLSVYGQSSPLCRRLLDAEDELFFIVSLLVENNSLRSHGASFAENIYGLRRNPMPVSNQAAGNSKSMTPGQSRMSLIILTLLPFLKCKLYRLYIQHRNQGQRSGSDSVIESMWDLFRSRKFSTLAKKLLLKVYPWTSTSLELLFFYYKLMYLLGKTPYFSPDLHFLGLSVVRLNPNEHARIEMEKVKHRSSRIESIRNSNSFFIAKLLREGGARFQQAISDHTRTALILAVFGFKALEWWYTTAEEALGSNASLPVPPPPPAYSTLHGEYKLPKDTAVCPLCLNRRVNPCLVSSSGYVFCYPCIFKYVEANGACPITGIAVDMSKLRRIFHDN
eukprot:jgi/Picsp_1/371/NSC_00369-R1_protein